MTFKDKLKRKKKTEDIAPDAPVVDVTIKSEDGEVLSETTTEETPKKSRFSKLKREKSPKKEKKPKEKKEKPYDPDSLSERWRRWKLIHQENYVELRTLSRDNKTGEYLCETTLVKWADLPRTAVHCTGENHVYCDDKIKPTEWYAVTHAQAQYNYDRDQFTASDAALYMMSNKIDNALATHWTELSHIDWKKIIIVAICGLAAVLILLMR